MQNNNGKKATKAELHEQRCARGSTALVNYRSKNIIIVAFSLLIAFSVYCKSFGNIMGMAIDNDMLNIIIATVVIGVAMYVFYLKTIYREQLYQAALKYNPDEQKP